MIGEGRPTSAPRVTKGDLRLEAAPGREDETTPYSRNGEGVGALAKSGLLSGDPGGSSLYRWVQGLGGEAELNRPYAQHPYIYACVSAVSRAASSVPARMQRLLPSGEYETVEGTDISKVFEFPNPLQSQRKFFRSVCTSQQLYGETFLILLKRGPGGQMVHVDAMGGTAGMMALIESPDEIWPVRGDMVDAMIDPKTKLPSMWRFTTATGFVDYPAHAIVQIAEVNPYNPLRGMGPMQAAYRTASKDFVIDRYDEALLQNGGSPGGVLTVDGPLTDGDQRAIREAWNEAHGRPESHRKTAVLPQGTTYKEIGMTPQAMEHEKLRTWDRQTILSMFGVPPVVLGLETMNYATAREQNRIFWETTVLSYLDFVKDELQYKLINRINGPESELILDFDISSVSALREDVDAKVDRTIKLYSQGHRTFIEAARLAGWEVDEETLEGGDERWLPGTLVQPGVGSIESEEDPDAIPEFDEEAEEERTLVGMCVDSPRLDTKGGPDGNAVKPSWPPHLDTEEKRVAFFKSYDEEEEKTIERASKKTQRIYRDLLLATRKTIRERTSRYRAAPPGVSKQVFTEAEIERFLGVNEEEWGEEMALALVPLLTALMLSGASRVASEIGADLPLIVEGSPVVAQSFAGYSARMATGPNATLLYDVRRAVLEALESADVVGATSLPEAVSKVLTDVEKRFGVLLEGVEARALRIARTETVRSFNEGRVAEMKAAGVKKHMWLSSRDGNVRDMHQIVDGQTIPVGDQFFNGLLFPGDPSGPPEEVVNCRCITVAEAK